MKFLIDNTAVGVSAYLVTQEEGLNEETMELEIVSSWADKFSSISDLQPYLYRIRIETEEDSTDIESEENHFKVLEYSDVSITNESDEDDYLCMKFKAIVDIDLDMDDYTMEECFKVDIEKVDYTIHLNSDSLGFAFPDGTKKQGAFDGGYEEDLQIKLEKI